MRLKKLIFKLGLMGLVIAMVLIMLPVNMLFADDSGVRSPSAVSFQEVSGITFRGVWVNRPYAMTSNNQYAVANAVTTTSGQIQYYTQWLTALNFGFNIPADATITGVSANVERKQRLTGDPAGFYDFMTCLLINNTIVTGSNVVSGPRSYWALTDEVKTFGDSTNTWGQALTPAIVNNGYFGFAVLPKRDGLVSPGWFSSTAYADVDYMSMTVYYTLPAPVDTTAPSISAPANVIVEGNTIGGASGVSLGLPIVSDIVDPNPVVANDAPSFFPLGTTTVTWTATDASNNSANATQDVTVVDTTPPVITPPSPITVEGDTLGGFAKTSLAAPTVSDIVDSNPLITNDAPVTLPLGPITVTWTATDASNNSANATQDVTVQDTAAPVITLNGSDPISIPYLGTYTEPGAEWTDVVDGNGSAIVSGDAVNNTIPGNYTIRYNYTDNAGNAAVEITRTVTVEPWATINVSTNIFNWKGVDIVDGATFTIQKNNADNKIISETISATYDKLAPGTYTITQLPDSKHMLKQIIGDNDGNPNNGASITVGSGQTINLTFINWNFNSNKK